MNPPWLDISTPLVSGMAHWPGDPNVEIDATETDGCRVTTLSMSAHTGTHIDAPLHYLAAGASVDQIPLDAVIGPACVAALDGAAEFSPGERVLFKTGGTAAVDQDMARRLAWSGVRTVGIEGLTIGDDEVHRVLLAAGIWIIEGLNLAAVEPGEYDLVCLPLKIVGADGAPARALLRKR